MATFNATDIFSKNVKSSADRGNEIVVSGSVTPGAGAVNDVYRVCPIPGGTYVHRVTFRNGDLDTNGVPTLAVKVGYKHADGSSGDDDAAFAAAGQLFLQSATAVGGGTAFFVKPVKVEKDSFLVITVGTASATFAAAEITGVVEGEGHGKK